jgi:hypothetical protein
MPKKSSGKKFKKVYPPKKMKDKDYTDSALHQRDHDRGITEHGDVYWGHPPWTGPRSGKRNRSHGAMRHKK